MIFSGGDITAWAKQIRENKTYALKAMIREREEFLRGFNPETDEYMSVKRVKALSDIARLNRKLSYLINT